MNGQSSKIFSMATNLTQSRYNQRGVSSDKSDVHKVVDKMDRGLFPGAFCKVTEDLLTNDDKLCNVIHSDGAGTKSILATCGIGKPETPMSFVASPKTA